MPDENRLVLSMGTILKNHLSLDFRLIRQRGRLLALPCRMPAITVLENWVKHYSIRACTCPSQTDAPRASSSSSRRSSSAKLEKREKDYERLEKNISLCKEVADGLRIYLNFMLRSQLLYAEEYQQADVFMSAAARRAFVYVAPERQTLDMLSVPKTGTADGGAADEASGAAAAAISGAADGRDAHHALAELGVVEPTNKRRLRSHKNDESNEYILDIGPVSGLKAGAKAG